MGRLWDRVSDALFSVPNAVADSTVVLPPIRGDVAQVSHLGPEVAAAFGINLSSDRVTRAQAMSIPAVRRGRQVIAGTLGAAPLRCTRVRNDVTERLDRQLLKQPDPNLTLAQTLTWTIDDLMFSGVSWWRVLERLEKFPYRAERLSLERVNVDPSSGVVRVDGTEADPANLIRFDGPDEGILTHGARALKTALLLEEAVRKFARLDIPLGLIQDEVGQMLEDEVLTFLDSWEKARASRTTGYLPHGLKYLNPTFNAEQLELGDARGFQAQEIARLMNLPANIINAPTNDSLTYSTTESNRRELVDLTFAPFIAAIEQRLSMPDVTPNGTTVYFDLGKFLRGDIKTVIETGALAVDSGLMTKDEVRTEWLSLPPLTKKENTDGDDS